MRCLIAIVVVLAAGCGPSERGAQASDAGPLRDDESNNSNRNSNGNNSNANNNTVVHDPGPCQQLAQQARITCALEDLAQWIEAACSAAAPSECELECYLARSCDDLRSGYCAAGWSEGFEPAECLAACPGNRLCPDGRVARSCDGLIECSDRSDEEVCEAEGTCDGGGLVAPQRLCDGVTDCADGSDEDACPLFTCANGDELPAPYQCDGVSHCLDGSDEIECAALHFRCADGSVIPRAYRCDRIIDCDGGSDEPPECNYHLACG